MVNEPSLEEHYSRIADRIRLILTLYRDRLTDEGKRLLYRAFYAAHQEIDDARRRRVVRAKAHYGQCEGARTGNS
ncbi:MAG TPA: hypothetical protein VNM43_02885 [Dehalococcoidia bacterium]|nr:hypothetical protein [Dehalococcoidia bacterium]